MEFYSTLPISKLRFSSRLSLEGILFLLPSSLIVFIMGSLFLETDALARIPYLLIAYFVSAFSLAGVGALLASAGKHRKA
jgi:hypothetical protein